VFDTVTKNIVSESICTAVFIDNEIIEPYTFIENPSDKDFLLPKQLYESFKGQSCLLDFYKYKDSSIWDSENESVLKNKDLIILDWELTEGSLKFVDSLKVLLDAVKTDSLPFVYIYTQEPELEKVVFNIFSYFSGCSSKEIADKKALFFEKLEDLSISGIPKSLKEKYSIIEELPPSSFYLVPDQFCHGVVDISKALLMNPKMKKEIKKQILEYIKTELDMQPKLAGQMCNLFFDVGKEVFGCEKDEDFLTLMILIFDGCYFPENSIDIRPKYVEEEKYTYLIHNTLVKISSKNLRGDSTRSDAVIAEEVYSEFSKTICGRPRNFLALLGLEMRNLFRKNASVIGKDINEIDELAFFHHQENICEGGDSNFHEFLKNMYKEEFSSFLLDQNPTLFNALQDYKVKNNIDAKLQWSRNDPKELLPNLAKLNYYYSVQRIKHNNNPRKVRFGDIFLIGYKKIEPIPTGEKNSYLLCITAHCECLYPNKINNCFHFVGGKEIQLKDGLKKGDRGYISYIKPEKGLLCIEWEISPFTLYIPSNNNDITKIIESDFSGNQLSMKHLTCLNENYAQRIANESFNWANRVGINFAKWDSDGGKSK
jgi:hypothetical protein